MKIYVYDRNGEKHTVEGAAGDSLMDPLRSADLVDATCGGSCSCATCHVYVDEKSYALLPTAGEEENEVIEFMEKVEDTSRLACQIELTEEMDGMAVTVAQEEGF
ncbi:MAG: 2Fe-2S iron-sulfur cluster binding domain-containing protein [Porticoccaceae bacterium]|nr:2Fe-2S iron-sulfur cluster binding domain-containing protein [Porticoccaceae bacterium]